MPEDFYTDGARLSPDVSAWFVTWVSLFAAIAVMLLALFFAWVYRRRARAHETRADTPPVASGPGVIEGTVEPRGENHDPVVTVDVEQEGVERQHKSSWYTVWTEVARRVNAAPFDVRLASGQIVRVEPGNAPFLADDLEDPVRVHKSKRTRSARLSPGETVQISGVLTRAATAKSGAGAYRASGGGEPWVMRSPRFGRMVLATRVALSVHKQRASLHRGFAVAFAVALGITHLVVLPSFHLLRANGQVVDARLTHTRTHGEFVRPKNSAGRWVTTYFVRATAALGRDTLTLSDESSAGLYFGARNGAIRRAPFVVMRAWPSIHQVGPRPTISEGRALGLSVLLFAMACAYGLSMLGTNPWYGRRRLVDHTSGRLS